MIKNIYQKLLKSFGPQHWWPVTKDNDKNPKYHKNINLNEKQKLEIIFGAILTQNTSWKNVEKAIINLNKHNLIDVKKTIKIDNKKLAHIIKSSGYHNQKAKKLKNFSGFLLENYNGNLKELFGNDIGKLRHELLSVNGIGPETADSIVLYAAKKPIFVIDAYTKRIMNRIGFKEESYDELQELFMDNLEHNGNIFNEYHALLVELGKNRCKTKPVCEECPLMKMCEYFSNQHI
ncbi:MAG: endonuclease III domain-containing protein [Candidatus Woesearchaeota archaeon]|jgi:endonuclease-3 related protein|nr:endonuclease III domain-containing protein [Candidatus Woesearchaeota archaeon]|tara:strand:- start:1636 stop:2337 length:702 start_codon:yes stop_codon:yes gene_type:complete